MGNMNLNSNNFSMNNNLNFGNLSNTNNTNKPKSNDPFDDLL